jgi:hypothetical protein
LLACACGKDAPAAEKIQLAPPAPPASYPISRAGGTPATGPDERKNSCERIWCPFHEANFFIDHFVTDHDGWIVHAEADGDLFVPLGGLRLAGVPRWRRSALRLCGKHVHPWVMGRGEGTPMRHTGYEQALGYDKKHYRKFGTRLHPCCINGLGSDFVHSDLESRFPFGHLAKYRAHPEIGWQKPFEARVTKPQN